MYATSQSENVGRVTITGVTGVTQSVWVFVANTAAKNSLFYANTSTAAGHNFFGLSDQRTQGPTLVKIWVQGDLLDDIDAKDLVVLQVQASVLAGVKSHGTNWATDHFRAKCGRVSRNKYGTASPHDGFQQLHHDITLIQTDNPTNPEFDCPISVPDGNLKSLVVGGYLGQNPVLSNGKYNPIDVSGYVDAISAQGIRMEITAGSGIGLINVSPSGMKGSITTPTLMNSSSAAGNIYMDAGFKPTTVLSSGLASGSSMIVNRWWGDDATGTGGTVKFRFGGSNRLAGQIIINADNQANASSEPGRWYDQIRVANPSDPNNESADYLLLGQDQSGDGTTSYTSAQLGGGAVGLVPFQLWAADCSPAQVDSSPYFDLLQSEFNGDWVDHQRDILLRFYGPVKNDGSGSPVRVFHVISSAVEADVTHRFTVTVNPAGMASARTVQVRGKPEVFHYPGLYRIEPVLSGDDTLYCDVPSKPAVADFSYSFWMLWDCDASGVADRDEIAADETDTLDSDGDGFLDVCTDLGGCLADFDDNGYVNGDDVDLFELLYEAGAIWADVNGDGFTNGTDLDVFGEAFEIGC